jgi:hypothetical protein
MKPSKTKQKKNCESALKLVSMTWEDGALCFRLQRSTSVTLPAGMVHHATPTQQRIMEGNGAIARETFNALRTN